MIINMIYSHPTEIHLSNDLVFDWIGGRIPLKDNKIGGDTYPQTWADDDEIYVGTGDPNWCEETYLQGLSLEQIDTHKRDMRPYVTGQVVEKISGNPDDFTLTRVHDMPGYMGYGGFGAKPCGMICVDGVLYYAVQNLLGKKTPPHRKDSQHASDATIICSRDHGRTWEPELNEMFSQFEKEQWSSESSFWKTTEEERVCYKDWKPMFPGSDFGGPSFVQFGKNNTDALDNYVYAVSADQWDNGRYLRLGRVSKDAILNRNKWEFASIRNKDNIPVWKADINEATPILDIEGHISLPEMVYIPVIKKFLLLTWGLHTDFYTPTGAQLTILESDNIWGPFSLIHYEWMWDFRALCPYTPRVPLKWFDQSTLEGYILHSGNWGYITSKGEWVSVFKYYRPHIKKFKLSKRDDCTGCQSL